MNRINTVSWVDGESITRMMNVLQEELMRWQKSCAPADPDNPGFVLSPQRVRTFGGDSAVIMAAYTLRDKLNKIIEASADANRLP